MVSLISLFDGFRVGPNGLTGVAELFFRITEAHGKYHISLELQELNTGHVVAEADGPEITIKDQLETNNVIIPIPPLPLPAGEYDIVIFANKAEIDRQKFTVQMLSGGA
jgi:hypothetical protein